jgi:hypothetical protein
VPGTRFSLGLLALLLTGASPTLAAQAPIFGGTDASSQLPRFTLRQMVLGRNDSLVRIPGNWLRAATVALPESVTTQAYTVAALRCGLTPLQGAALTSERSQHVMGLYRRRELIEASRRTLQAIRDAIPSDTTRARFDRIFRPQGDWIVDVHEAALAWARARMSGLTWESARPALAAAHWIGGTDSLDWVDALPRALYGLAVLAATDSAAFAATRADLWQADSTAATAVETLLKGYTESQRWYADALGFFLSQPWIPARAGRSMADVVHADWDSVLPSPDQSGRAVPEVQTHWFGYPQAVPHYGVPPALVQQLIKTENASATDWLARHGESGLLSTLRRLPLGDTSLTLLRAGSESLRLTTVPRQSRESLNGFLEPRDAIAIDPGYSPLLALGAVVHEWQHLRFRRRQLQVFAEHLKSPGSSIELPGVQPDLAEGFAEWSTERILAQVVARWPLLGLGEIEKRAGLARTGPDDQHAIGYALVHALAAVLPDARAVTGLLLRYADYPAGLATEPALRKAWRKYRRFPDRVLQGPAYRLLIPEVTFTIEDGFPDVVATRILVPVDGHGER